jgi:hypothetical protein
MNTKDLISILSDSPKWCAYFVGEYPNEYAHFIYVPKMPNCNMFKLSIALAPGGERKPDLNKDATIRILLKDAGALLYVHVPKEAVKDIDHFILFIKQILADVADNTIQYEFINN